MCTVAGRLARSSLHRQGEQAPGAAAACAAFCRVAEEHQGRARCVTALAGAAWGRMLLLKPQGSGGARHTRPLHRQDRYLTCTRATGSVVVAGFRLGELNATAVAAATPLYEPPTHYKSPCFGANHSFRPRPAVYEGT